MIQYGDSGTIKINKNDATEKKLNIKAIVLHARNIPRMYVNRMPSDTNTLLKFNSIGLSFG